MFYGVTTLVGIRLHLLQWFFPTEIYVVVLYGVELLVLPAHAGSVLAQMDMFFL